MVIDRGMAEYVQRVDELRIQVLALCGSRAQAELVLAYVKDVASTQPFVAYEAALSHAMEMLRMGWTAQPPGACARRLAERGQYSAEHWQAEIGMLRWRAASAGKDVRDEDAEAVAEVVAGTGSAPHMLRIAGELIARCRP